MAVDVSRTQDVYKDAGQSVNFTTLLLNRKDRGAELEVIQDMADRIQAIKRSVSIRANGEGLGIAFGFSRKAWDYLFPNAPVPKELEDFAISTNTNRTFNGLNTISHILDYF